MDGCVGGWMDGWICNGWMDDRCSLEFVLRSEHIGGRWGVLRQKQCSGTSWTPTPSRMWQAKHWIQALQILGEFFFFYCLFFFFWRWMLKVWHCRQKKKRSGTEWIGSTAGGKTIRHRCNTLVWGNVTIQWVVLWQERLPCWKAASSGNIHWRTLILDQPL